MSVKNKTISTIRMICTISIVILHIFQQYEALVPSLRIITDWLNLGLVMFFCISAFLYSQREVTNIFHWLHRRFRDLIVPSILIGLFTIVVSFLYGHMNHQRLIGTLLSCLGFQVWASDSWLFIQLWFLSYILFCYLTVPLIQKIPCKTCSSVTFWLLLLAISATVQIAVYTLESIMGIELLSVGILLRFYIPYFLFRRYAIHSRPLKRIMCTLSILALLAIVVTCFCRYTELVPLPAPITELVFIYAQTLVGIVCFYWVYLGLSQIQIPPSLLSISDTYSYPVYLTHCLFIGYSTSVIKTFHYSVFGVLLALLCTMLASLGVHKLVQLLFRRKVFVEKLFRKC